MKNVASADPVEFASANEALLAPPEHVLSTLENDGSRRWIYPKLWMGKFWVARRYVAYLLMAIFVVVPHINVADKPLILLDIAAFEFTVFGFTFLPTDTFALALFALSVLVSIVLLTAITGRAWCGWACPQTVYMEYLFRPIDRVFEGTMGKGGRPKKDTNGWRGIARLAVYICLAMFLAHTFLAYFVGVEKLSQWVRSSPIHHPMAFVVMLGTTIAMLFNFLFFREQMCTLACPYGRLQSVMLDPHSLIVGFDYRRGEPRRKGKRPAEPTPQENDRVGDCVDCNQCVVVCPMGIDIRDGLQMECINCTQCIDACDDVMDRVGSPRGLIRYTSQESLEGRPSRLVRARTIVYPLILAGVFTGLVLAIAGKSGFDARVIRGKGMPFTMGQGSRVVNAFSIRLVNRSSEPQTYAFTCEEPSLSIEVVDEADLTLPPSGTALAPIVIRFSSELTQLDGNERVLLRVQDSAGRNKELPIRLLGPR